MAWMKQGASADNSVIQEVDTLGRWLAHNLHDYLMATVYVTVVTLVRVTILVLSVPSVCDGGSGGCGGRSGKT